MPTKPETGENGRSGSSANFSKPLFTVKGVVELGKGRGVELGFPTVNIPCEEWVPNGIFAGYVLWRNRAYPAAIFKDHRKDILEAYLLDFSGDLYEEKITIIGYQKIRGVKRFKNDEELMSAITQDIQDVKESLKTLQQ